MPVTYDDCVFADRVLERSNTTGLDDFICVGTRLGYRTFLAGLDESDVTVYLAEHETNGQWEIGKGTVGAAGLVSRDEIIASSTGAKVDFSEGQKLVRCTLPAELIAQFAGFAIPFVDTQALVHDPADATKLMRIDAGAVATGTTRVLSMPNKNVDLDAAILSDGTVAFAADQSLGGNKLTNVEDPASDQDAATKAYVDAQFAGAGTGDVVGPSSSTDNGITRFDGTTGKVVQDSNNTISDAGKIKGKSSYSELSTHSGSGTITLDLDVDNIHLVTMTGDATGALSHVSVGQRFAVRLQQDATGGRTWTWWSGIHWPGDIAPSVNTVASRWDWYGFICTGTGEYGAGEFDGFALGQDYRP